MDRNFARALKLVLKHEGGFVNHPRDPGGATNKGITLATFRRYVNGKGTVDDLRRITDAEVATVYRKQYWNVVKGDELPDGVDYAVFDFAVNSGPARAAKFLQRAVGAAQDGKIGPATAGAVKAMARVGIVNRLCDDRMAFLRGLNTWSTFGKGWTSRVKEVRAVALSMAADAALGTSPKPVAPIPPPAPPKPVEPRPVAPVPAPPAPKAESLLARLLGAILAVFRR